MMYRHFHDNKGNRLVVAGDDFWVIRDNGLTSGPFHSLSGAAKSITGYETNGRKYWKLSPPRPEDARFQLVCDKGQVLSGLLTMPDPDNRQRAIHLHAPKHTHHNAGLCDADADRMRPDNEAAERMLRLHILTS